MSNYNDFSSDPNSPNSPGFSNYQNLTSLLAGNTNTPPPPHQLAMNEWQQFQQFQQFRQQQQFQPQPQSFNQPQQQQFQPQPQSFHQPQQQAFSQPQPPQVAEPSRPRKRKDKGKKVVEPTDEPTDEPDVTPNARSVQWTQAQERRLAENWIHVSEDRKIGNNRDGLTFWFAVMAIFNKDLTEPFTKNSLSSKWRAMSKLVKLFAACHDRAHRDRQSGEDDKKVYTTALRMFQAENGRAFRHHSAFEVLYKAPRFANPEPINPINLEDDVEPDFFGHDKIPRPQGRPRPSKSARSSSSSDVTSKREDFNEDLIQEVRDLKVAKTKEINIRIRHRKMEFLLIPTDNLPPRDRARIERQKDKYRAELDIAEGDEGDEDEDEE